MTAPAPTAAVLEAFGATNLRVRQLLTDSREAQWRAGKSPVPKEDTTERSKGLVNDPTATTTLDPRRVALRVAVIDAERALRQADAAMRHAIAVLEASRVAHGDMASPGTLPPG